MFPSESAFTYIPHFLCCGRFFLKYFLILFEHFIIIYKIFLISNFADFSDSFLRKMDSPQFQWNYWDLFYNICDMDSLAKYLSTYKNNLIFHYWVEYSKCSNWVNVFHWYLFRSSIYLLILVSFFHCWLRTLESWTMIVDLFIFLFLFIHLSFTCFEFLLLDAFTFRFIMCSWCIKLFHLNMLLYPW